MSGMVMLVVVLMVGLSAGLVRSSTEDLAKDKAECTPKMTVLAPCLPYVSGDATAPTIDCCTGSQQVVKESKKCVCLLVKYKDDPSLGIKINTTKAFALPAACHISNTFFTQCPAILHLASGSPEAKVFDDFAKSAAAGGNKTTSPSPSTATTDNTPSAGSSAAATSNAGVKLGGGGGTKWFGLAGAAPLQTYGIIHLLCLVFYYGHP